MRRDRMERSKLLNTRVSSFETGQHARISKLPLSSNAPRGQILKRLGVGRNLTRAEASTLLDECEAYRHQLSRANIRIPPVSSAEILAIDTEYQIWIVEDYILGSSARLRSPSTMSAEALEIVIRAIAILERLKDFDSKRTTGPPNCMVAIDFKPSNLIRSRGGLVLVDTFPPLRVDSGRITSASFNVKLHRFSYEKLSYVTNTRVGMISRFTKLLLADMTDVSDVRACEQLLADQIEARSPRGSGFLTAFVNELRDDFPGLSRFY
jgi:hypothetical protein